MSRGSSEFVIEVDGKYASGITVFGDVVEVETWVDSTNDADKMFGDVYAKHIAGKVGGIAVNVDSEYGEYDE